MYYILDSGRINIGGCMEKIGIINCYEISKKCAGVGCINAFNEKSGAFDKYAFKDVEITNFVQCNGCNDNATVDIIEKSKKMEAEGIKTIHLSTCIKSDCKWYDEFVEELSKKFEVIDFTHGSE